MKGISLSLIAIVAFSLFERISGWSLFVSGYIPVGLQYTHQLNFDSSSVPTNNVFTGTNGGVKGRTRGCFQNSLKLCANGNEKNENESNFLVPPFEDRERQLCRSWYLSITFQENGNEFFISWMFSLTLLVLLNGSN